MLAVVLALAAYVRVALNQRVPGDVTMLPPGPPDTLPDFVIAQSPTASPRSTPLAGPTPTVKLRPSPASQKTQPPDEDSRPPSREPSQCAPTRILATSIGLDSAIIPVAWRVQETDEGTQTVWEVASNAAGWHVNSRCPGEGGNVVLSGHNNIEGEVFRDLIDLKIGDVVQLYVNDVAYPYGVVDKLLLEEKGMPAEVRRANAAWIGPTEYERLTLVTCWPYSTYTHRLIVLAAPAE
jgi:sortase A